MTTIGIPPGGVAYAFERIFTIYSERDLTYQRDRPNAIAGLQRRMTDVYMTESSNGIIHCCLGRSPALATVRDQENEKDNGSEHSKIPIMVLDEI
jgi:hypothetical protein